MPAVRQRAPEGGIERRGTRPDDQEQIVVRPQHLLEARAASVVIGNEIGAVVRPNRLGKRRENFGFRGGGPRNEKMPLLALRQANLRNTGMRVAYEPRGLSRSPVD